MRKQKGDKAVEELVSGLSMTAVFGGVYLVTGSNIWLLVGVFAGIIPAIGGAGKLLARRYNAELPRPQDERARVERQILRSAQQHHGRVTPTRIAVDANCSIDHAQQILDDLATKGFCTLEITENGRIEYQFSDLLPQDHSPDAT